MMYIYLKVWWRVQWLGLLLSLLLPQVQSPLRKLRSCKSSGETPSPQKKLVEL